MTRPAPPLGPDLRALLATLPHPLAEATRISGHGATRPSRETWRLRFADGSLRKGRRLADAGLARQVEAIVAVLDADRFPRVIARRGVALLEQWVRGAALDGRPIDDAQVSWAGDTLAAVHVTTPPPGLAAPPEPRAHLEEDLRWLVEAGALDDAQAGRLRARTAPGSSLALVHRDLCPENIVSDDGGRLRIVDNAAARLGHPDEDLARTFYRWPMDAAQEACFLEAYARRRDAAGFLEHRAFWTAMALAHASRVRLHRGYARADETLRLLIAEAG